MESRPRAGGEGPKTRSESLFSLLRSMLVAWVDKDGGVRDAQPRRGKQARHSAAPRRDGLGGGGGARRHRGRPHPSTTHPSITHPSTTRSAGARHPRAR